VDGLTRTSGAPRRSTDLNRRTSFDVSLASACTASSALSLLQSAAAGCLCPPSRYTLAGSHARPTNVLCWQGPRAAGWNDGYQESTYFQSRGTAPYVPKNSSHEDLTILATSKETQVRPARPCSQHDSGLCVPGLNAQILLST